MSKILEDEITMLKVELALSRDSEDDLAETVHRLTCELVAARETALELVQAHAQASAKLAQRELGTT